MRSAVAGSVEALKVGEPVDESEKFGHISESITNLDLSSAATTVSTLPSVASAMKLRSQLRDIVKTLLLPEAPVAVPNLEFRDASGNIMSTVPSESPHVELS
jgi:hypothetical protein